MYLIRFLESIFVSKPVFFFLLTLKSRWYFSASGLLDGIGTQPLFAHLSVCAFCAFYPSLVSVQSLVSPVQCRTSLPQGHRLQFTITLEFTYSLKCYNSLIVWRVEASSATGYYPHWIHSKIISVSQSSLLNVKNWKCPSGRF